MRTKRPERLKGVDYTGFQRYSLTICTAFRRPALADPAIAERIITRLQETARSYHFSVPVYCLMPDHMHALASAAGEQANLREFVRIFKQTTAFDYRKEHHGSLWQPGYYERILRDDEATEEVVRYILSNPVRAGLTGKLGDYPYCGSDTYEISDLLDLWRRRRKGYVDRRT